MTGGAFFSLKKSVLRFIDSVVNFFRVKINLEILVEIVLQSLIFKPHSKHEIKST